MNQPEYENWRVLLRPLWIFFLAAMVGLATIVSLATGVTEAATYQFYFNNTEQQGANSTASPSLTVGTTPGAAASPLPLGDSGKVAILPNPAASASPVPVAAAASPLPTAESQPPTTTPAVTPETAESVAKVEVKSDDDRPPFNPWRFDLSAAVIGLRSTTVYFDQVRNGLDRAYGAGVLEFAYFPTRRIGVNTFGGAHMYLRNERVARGFLGLEAEAVPVRISIWKLYDLIEMGLMAGGSTLARAKDNWGTLHLGARLTLNFGSHFGITSSVRGNMGFVLADAGLSFRM